MMLDQYHRTCHPSRQGWPLPLTGKACWGRKCNLLWHSQTPSDCSARRASRCNEDQLGEHVLPAVQRRKAAQTFLSLTQNMTELRWADLKTQTSKENALSLNYIESKNNRKINITNTIKQTDLTLTGLHDGKPMLWRVFQDRLQTNMPSTDQRTFSPSWSKSCSRMLSKASKSKTWLAFGFWFQSWSRPKQETLSRQGAKESWSSFPSESQWERYRFNWWNRLGANHCIKQVFFLHTHSRATKDLRNCSEDLSSLGFSTVSLRFFLAGAGAFGSSLLPLLLLQQSITGCNGMSADPCSAKASFHDAARLHHMLVTHWHLDFLVNDSVVQESSNRLSLVISKKIL